MNRFKTRALAVSFLLLSLVAAAPAEESVAPADAAKYVGKTVTVEGAVAQVSVSGKGTTFVNFGAPFPNQVFNAVIFRSARGQFSADPVSWNGKRVRVRGTVRMYQGKPEIVLDRPDQIEVVEAK